MTDILRSPHRNAQAGDLVQLIVEKNRSFIFTLQPGEKFQSHLGIIPHEDLIGLAILDEFTEVEECGAV